jgi:hypothetical protein
VRTLLFALGALALVGCKEMGVRPAGPLAKYAPPTQKSQPLPMAAPDAVASKAPAVKLAPPTMNVTPGEVTADNAHLLAQKLSSELTTDSKATANMPVTAEVSKVGRVPNK